MWKPLDLKKKENKSAACFVFATTTWSWSRASSVPSQPLLCMSMGSKKSFKSKSKIKKNLNEKKSFVWMFRIDLKKYKKNYCCDKKQFTQHRAIQSHCGLLTRKEKRPVTVALPYPFPLHQNEGKQQKKSKSKAFFMFFQQHYKRTNFSVFDDHIYARSPTLPPS